MARAPRVSRPPRPPRPEAVARGQPSASPPGTSGRQDDSLVERVADEIRERIATRALTVGARLPSLRDHAARSGVSKSTVVEAYERLVSEGLLRARPGAGFYVAAHALPLSLQETGPGPVREVDPLWVARQSLEAGNDVLKPGCGWLPPDWLPQASLRRAARMLARGSDAVLAEYDAPQGHSPLRALLARRLREREIPARPAQLMLTDSGTQALDLICRLLLEPGDAVLVDDPCYFNFQALLRAHRVRPVGVPYTPEGPDPACFEHALLTHRPRLYLTNSAIHNPTGASLSARVAQRVLALAEAHGLTIVEDDIFADFEPEPAPRLASFDGLARVVHVGSFSKTLSASVRCGYIAAREDWIERLVDLRIATAFGGARVGAELVCAALTDGSYRRHVDGLRRKLALAMEHTRQGLEALGIQPWTEPRGGLFLWCALPSGCDATEVARHALARGMVLAPGNVFSVSHSAGAMMRFNVSQCEDPRVFPCLAEALAAG